MNRLSQAFQPLDLNFYRPLNWEVSPKKKALGALLFGTSYCRKCFYGLLVPAFKRRT